MAEVPLAADPDAPLVAMAFKLVEEPFGQVTYMRIYQGTLKKGDVLLQHPAAEEGADQPDPPRPRRPEGRHRLGLAPATSSPSWASSAPPATRTAPRARTSRSRASTPPSRSSTCRSSPTKRADYDKLSKALNRFMREDPTFRVHVDQETSETIISGMGELHLEIYVERIRREYKVECTVGAPEGQLPRGADQGDAVQLQAQEADRRLGPVRPRRRHAGARCPQDAPSRSSSRTRSPAAGSRASTSPRSRRASATRCTRGRSPATRSSASLRDAASHVPDVLRPGDRFRKQGDDRKVCGSAVANRTGDSRRCSNAQSISGSHAVERSAGRQNRNVGQWTAEKRLWANTNSQT